MSPRPPRPFAAAARRRAGSRVRPAILFCAAIALLIAPAAWSAPGDTTWVHTYVNDYFNWADHHVASFTFPDTSLHSSKVVLFYRIGCPPAPGDCDPWDRLGYLQLHAPAPGGGPDSVSIEIARVITPYDITGAGRPGTCQWQLDVSDYEPLLHGRVVLDDYIETYIGGNRGWLATVDFAFIQGESENKPYKIQNLWENYRTIYGDPTQPIENTLFPMVAAIDSAATQRCCR